MSDLFVDRRVEMGDAPGLHALIVGIGAYPFLPKLGAPGRPEQFGLAQVDGPAVSAFRLAQLLKSPPAGSRLVQPLKTLRLLLAPTEADVAAEPGLSGWAGPLPSRATVKQAALDWRTNCEASDDEVSLFAFFGHGVNFSEDYLVLADHGQGATPDNVSLEYCAPLDSLMGALSGPGQIGGIAIARRQFWFIDACRIYVGDDRPGEISHAPPLIPPRREDGRGLASGGLISTGLGLSAFAAGKDGSTPFGAALLKALNGAVGEPITWPAEGDPASQAWPVTVTTIRQAIDRNFDRLQPPLEQKSRGLGADARPPLLLFDTRLSFQLWCRVRPPRDPTVIASLRLKDLEADDAWRDFPAIDPHPLLIPLLAGQCRAEWVTGGQPAKKFWFASLAADELEL